jgi:hypothetical protein
MGQADELVDIYLLEDVVASKSVVESQGAILEVILKLLGIGREGCT